MIYGIGTDIVQINRIAGVVARTNGRFITRILGVEEQQQYHARAARCAERGLAFLASRFAAKEAFVKALGLGMRQPMTWHAMQTLNEPNGRPQIVVDAKLAAWLQARRIEVHVTLSEEKEYAVAYVLAEQR